MTRLPILIPIVGAVLATVCVYALLGLLGGADLLTQVAATLLILLGYAGAAGVASFLAGWPQVEVTEEREP